MKPAPAPSRLFVMRGRNVGLGLNIALGLLIFCSLPSYSRAGNGDVAGTLGQNSHSVVLQWVDYSRELKKRGDSEGARQALAQLIPQIPKNETQGRNSLALIRIEQVQGEVERGGGGDVEDATRNAMLAIEELESKDVQSEALLLLYPPLKVANSEGRYSDPEFLNFLGMLWEMWPMDKKADDEGLLFEAQADLAVLLVKKGERDGALSVGGSAIEKWTGEQRQGNFGAMRNATMAVVGAHALGKSGNRGLFSDPSDREMLLGTVILAHAFKLAEEGDPEGKLIAGDLLGTGHLGNADANQNPEKTEEEQLELALAAVASAGDFFKEKGDGNMSRLFEKESRVLKSAAEAKKYWWVAVLVLLGVVAGFVVFFMMPVSFILGRINRAKVKKMEDFLRDTVVIDIPRARAT